MIQTLQSHYGFTVMPFTASVPVTALFGSAATKKPSPGSAGSSPPGASAC